MKDFKLFAVSLGVLFLSGGVAAACKKTTKCQEEGGSCFEEDQVPLGFLHIGGCKGKCKCYKDVGSEALALSARSSFPNMTAPDTNTTIPAEEEGNRGIQLRAGYSCHENDWDRPQYCRCRPGQRISKMYSYHNSRKEDRRWTLTCEDILQKDIAQATNWQTGTSGENGWDSPFHWHGISSNSYMVGMSSYHDSHREDRRYKVFWARSDNWVLKNCGSHKYGNWHQLNYFDRNLNLQLNARQVIVELYSLHNNHKEDREFYAKWCDLAPKCDELVSITYGKIEQSKNDNALISENKSDNRNGKSQKSYTLSISQSQQNRYADKYEYSRTSGWSTTNSLSITVGASLGFPGVGEASLSATTGFELTFKGSKTWTRSHTKEYAETHGSQTSWTSTCNPGCYCKTSIKASYGEARIPYTMISKSSGKRNPHTRYETCKEEGVLKVSRSWNTHDVHDDNCSPSACPEGWSKHENGYGTKCYKLVTTLRTWESASRACKEQGGDLVGIPDTSTKDFIVKLGRSIQRTFILWVGGYDEPKEGAWRWIDGTPWGYTNWHSGEPNNHAGIEDCMVIDETGKWTDVQCGRRTHWYVCTKPL